MMSDTRHLSFCMRINYCVLLSWLTDASLSAPCAEQSCLSARGALTRDILYRSVPRDAPIVVHKSKRCRSAPRRFDDRQSRCTSLDLSAFPLNHKMWPNIRHSDLCDLASIHLQYPTASRFEFDRLFRGSRTNYNNYSRLLRLSLQVTISIATTVITIQEPLYFQDRRIVPRFVSRRSTCVLAPLLAQYNCTFFPATA
jgi:hypothetical protein